MKQQISSPLEDPRKDLLMNPILACMEMDWNRKLSNVWTPSIIAQFLLLKVDIDLDI